MYDSSPNWTQESSLRASCFLPPLLFRLPPNNINLEILYYHATLLPIIPYTLCSIYHEPVDLRPAGERSSSAPSCDSSNSRNPAAVKAGKRVGVLVSTPGRLAGHVRATPSFLLEYSSSAYGG